MAMTGISPSALLDTETRELLLGFEACTLPTDAFHHHQHVQVGWAMLRQAPDLLAGLRRFSTGLRRFARHHGASGLYHETITWAFLFLIHERMQRLGDDHGWDAFVTASDDLLGDSRAALGRYYSEARLGSAAARAGFLMPDRSPEAAPRSATFDPGGGHGRPG